MSKVNHLILGLFASVVALGYGLCSSVRAQSIYYSCTLNDSLQPITVAIAGNEAIPIIYWQNQSAFLAGEDANSTCLKFSQRLHSYAQPDRSLYVGIGQINDLQFICAATPFGDCTGPNSGYLLDLPIAGSSEQILRQLFQPDVSATYGQGRNFVLL